MYCRSDAASLCLSCDCNVHSANALSRRHPRTLVCERCNSQPAFVRCVEETISLCQNCDWLAHVGSNISPSHKRQAINSYSGCPSASELSAIWPFLLDFPSVGDSTCEQGMSSMSITDNTMDRQGPQEKDNVQDESILRDTSDQYKVNVNKSTAWTEAPTHVDQMDGSTCSAMPKVSILFNFLQLLLVR